jgi:hypothetical protein
LLQNGNAERFFHRTITKLSMHAYSEAWPADHAQPCRGLDLEIIRMHESFFRKASVDRWKLGTYSCLDTYLSLCAKHRDSSSIKWLGGDACSMVNWTMDLNLVTLDYLTVLGSALLIEVQCNVLRV